MGQRYDANVWNVQIKEWNPKYMTVLELQLERYCKGSHQNEICLFVSNCFLIWFWVAKTQLGTIRITWFDSNFFYNWIPFGN